MITRAQVEQLLERPLREGEAERIAKAFDRSSIPEAVDTVLDAFRNYDEDEDRDEDEDQA